MTPFRESPEFMRQQEIADARCRAYEAYVSPWMNRAERRTSKGRMLVAQGEAAAMKAELEILRRQVEEMSA
jgi:hypothetical protein